MNTESLVVKLEAVGKTYEQGAIVVNAVTDVSFVVEKGGFLSLCGPSGSGKSTLLNLIGGLDKSTSGKVFVAGKDLSNMNKSELAELRLEYVGFIFQAFNLIPVLTAMENVEFVMQLQGVAKDERKERASEILKEVGLSEMENRKPGELSGGQQQRVAVARAIVSKPALILADEPTANLDSKAAEGLLDIMHEMNQHYGSTFIFSTHDKLVMQHARRIIQLKDGIIVSDERQN